MNRQELILEIRKIADSHKALPDLIKTKTFIEYPQYKYLKDAFSDYKKVYHHNIQWDQFARFALTEPDDRAYMCERVILLSTRYIFSHEKYFEIRTEYGTSPFLDRISALNRLLLLYFEYYKIFSNIVSRIHFDYPWKEYNSRYIAGSIDWTKTFRKSPFGFPHEFRIRKLNRQFNIPENILLLLGAYWLGKESTRVLQIPFIEPLYNSEIAILNNICTKSFKILTLFPFREIIDEAKKYHGLDTTDKKIDNLIKLAKKRITNGAITNIEYSKLLNWIRKFMELNIRMFSEHITNFPMDNISALDTIYEVWIILEFIDFLNSNNIKVDQINEQTLNFEFKLPGCKTKLKFLYENQFKREDNEIWAGETYIKPDFCIMTKDNIIAVFDAKNYTDDRAKSACDIMLAYITNLDTNYGAILSPNYPDKDYVYPKSPATRYHVDLKLSFYRLDPSGKETTIRSNKVTMTKILDEITSRALMIDNKIFKIYSI